MNNNNDSRKSYRAILLCLATLTGCQAGYYWHLARGHTALITLSGTGAQALRPGTLADGFHNLANALADLAAPAQSLQPAGAAS